jgi:hypothetical protein
MTKANKEKLDAVLRLRTLAPHADFKDAYALRRAAMTLHTWYENECNGTIQRDEDTNKCSWYSDKTGKRVGHANDRETPAIKRIAGICERLGIYYYLQTDPRGKTLYVSKNRIDSKNYSHATCIA